MLKNYKLIGYIICIILLASGIYNIFKGYYSFGSFILAFSCFGYIGIDRVLEKIDPNDVILKTKKCKNTDGIDFDVIFYEKRVKAESESDVIWIDYNECNISEVDDNRLLFSQVNNSDLKWYFDFDTKLDKNAFIKFIEKKKRLTD